MRPANRDRTAWGLGYLALVLVLGGASAGGFLANALLQLIAAAVLAGALVRRPGDLVPDSRALRLLAICIGATAVLQFVPLPYGLWKALPGRAMVAEGIEAVGAPQTWQTLSLSPWDGLAAMTWLLPAAAVAAWLATAPRMPQRGIALLVTGFALGSVVVGALQFASGQAYFYQITNRGVAVGFFANANHLGDLLLLAIVLASAARVDILAEASRRGPRTFIAQRAVYGAVLAVLLSGIWMTQSAAAMGLALVALAGAALLHRPDARLTWAMLAILIVATAGLAAALSYSGVLTDNFAAATAGLGLNRLTFAETTLAMIGATFPLGSGVGTYAAYYTLFEDPAGVGRVFVNHAHNDYLELAAETGLVGIAAIGIFILWWATRTRAVMARKRNSPYPLAGAIGIGVILAHSVVDYPLRTAAIATLFAICCVFMHRKQPVTVRSGRSSASAERTAVAI